MTTCKKIWSCSEQVVFNSCLAHARREKRKNTAYQQNKCTPCRKCVHIL